MRVHLTDFGLARVAATGSRLTRTGQALGTPAYMSPEAARGETSALTPGADVWALGCVLYELLTGRRAFDGETPAEVVGAVLTGPPPPLRRIRPDVPGALDAVLRTALARRPEHRYRSAAALAADVRMVLAGRRPAAALRVRRRRAAALAAGVLAVAAAVAVTAWAVRPAGRAPPAAGPPEARPGDREAELSRRLRASDPARAAEFLRVALQRDPARQDWRLDLGLLSWATGDEAGARDAWSAIPAGAAEAEAARVSLGLEALTRHDLPTARAHFQRLERGGGRWAGLAAGMLEIERHDWAAARRCFREAPGWQGAVLRGYLECRDPAGDRARGVRELDVALAQGVAAAWIYQTRGSCQTRAGQLDAAIADFTTALRLRPDHGATLAERSLARRMSGDIAGALADAEAAVARHPRAQSSLRARAHARRAIGDAVGARVDLDVLLALAPDDVDALIERAIVRGDGGDGAGAIADFTAALRGGPRDAEIYANRAHTRLGMGQPEAAVADYGMALTVRPDHLPALRARSDVRRRLGDLLGALEDAAAAVRLDPRDPISLHHRGNALLALDRPADALPDLEAADRISPSDAQVLGSLGAARMALDDPDAAIVAFERALSLTPDVAHLHNNLGLALQAAGQPERALAAFAECVRLAPRDPRVPAVRRSMEACRAALGRR